MSKFEQAVAVILHHEGGEVNDPRDPGGHTNGGVTQKTLDYMRRKYPNAGLPASVSDLKMPHFKFIYRAGYWDLVQGDKLPYAVALQVFDMAVNAGVGVAVRLLQGLAGAHNDGIAGPQTVAYVNAMDACKLAGDYHAARQRYYTGLNGFKHYGKGWTRRAAETYKEAIKG